KILSKVIVVRVSKVLDEVISPNQMAFMRKRQILDWVLIANELVDEVKKGNKPALIFKIDFEKAYDMVNWNF
ncbi:reverse transcriptase domain-containing protein, partial [Shigella flexneri]|nr:reverse transcriptase domain-containing protein [Shigella flexneri]